MFMSNAYQFLDDCWSFAIVNKLCVNPVFISNRKSKQSVNYSSYPPLRQATDCRYRSEHCCPLQLSLGRLTQRWVNGKVVEI